MQYTVNKNEDGLWIVSDELATVISVHDTRAEARNAVKELTATKSNVTHIEGTYGTGIERDDTAEQVADTQVVEAVTVAEVAEMPADLKRNSDKVRWRITLAKANNEDKETVVKWAVATLGQKRPLAWSYVKNNWDKA